MTIEPDGTRYVADIGRGQVLIFTRRGSYVGAVGEPDDMKAVDVAVSKDRIYVADFDGPSVRVFDKRTRKAIQTIPSDPKSENEALFGPTNLALDPDGNLYVSDTRAFRIQHYRADGAHIKTVGSLGDSPGQFSRPKGIAVDREGRLYAVDAATQVIQVFDAEGKLLLFFGRPGEGRAELDLPAQITIDYDNIDWFRQYADPNFELEYLLLVTSQYGANKVNVFGFGRLK